MSIGHRTKTVRRHGHRCRYNAGVVDSIATIDLRKVWNKYVACGYTSLRLGIDGLAVIVTQQFAGQLKEESLFLVRSYEPGEFVRQIPEQTRRKKA